VYNNYMKVYKLEYNQTIHNKTLDEVFTFFSNPINLSTITPKKLKFNILTPSTIKMQKGQLIDYTINLLGKEVRWKTLISEYSPPHYFIDQQLNGPYSFWHHKHIFQKYNNGVHIKDIIHYAIPLGPIGRLINYLWVENDLNNIFKYRYEVINKIFNNKG